MSSIQKLVYHWKQGQFIPGGKPPQPLNNEVKGQRLSELNGDDMIALEITKGISILKDAVEAFKKTQEFNKDPTSFTGDARDVLMSDDFLLVADMLRLIFPEGMISKVWQLKRGRDDDLDIQDDDRSPGNRPMLIPKSKKRRLDRLGEQEELINSERGASKVWALGSEGSGNRQIGFANRPEAQQHKAGGIFGIPKSQVRFTNRPKPQEPTDPLSSVEATGYTGIFGAAKRDINNSPAPLPFVAKSPTPEYTGIFSQRMHFTSEKPTNPVVSTGSPSSVEATGYKGIFGAAKRDSDSAPTPLSFVTKSPTPEYTGIFSQRMHFTSEKPTDPVVSESTGPPSSVEATGYKGIFGAAKRDSDSAPAPLPFVAKSPTPEYTGIFSQRMHFTSEKPTDPVVSEGSGKVSDTSPTPQYTGIFGAKSSKPQTGGIFSTTNPSLEHTGSSSQYVGSLSGNKEDAILDNLLSSMADDDVNKILAQLQLRQQGTKRKYEEEEETINKKRNNTQEPHSLIEL
ncbi:hypothetical protein FACUT_13908 [Fusarium acutatum]|uniref:Uncharacterized protein n=1 Tax=Fusarium acutatum TaxID=78861 RepID=A0A8H4JAW6_9HYPO|nr:hypothetical protein FACUT_13908 [Fusarium acutatum]